MRKNVRMHSFPMTVQTLSILLMGSVMLLSGCAFRAQSTIPVRQYTLEYASPAFGDRHSIDAAIRIETLSIAKSYNGTAMVYRESPFLYGDDAYNRWRVKPADMISDLLLRDLRNAGLFRGVFSADDSEEASYVLGGTIEEFYELDEANGSKAVIALNIFLIDTREKATSQCTLFQKHFRAVQPLEGQNAESLARAASSAMETISRQIITETYRAIRSSRELNN
jgi:ABC-type uncharacterized transport system auxiliary subunit